MFIYYKRTVLYSLISLIGICVIVTYDFQKVFHWYFSELTTIATRLQVKRDVSSMEFPHVINSPTVRPNCIVIIISHIALAINRKLVIRIQSTTHEECRWADDLPSLGRERSGGKNHWSLWHMASAKPRLRLPSQPQGITLLAGTKLYALVTEAHSVRTTGPRMLRESEAAGSQLK